MPKQNLLSLCAKIAYISSAFLLLALVFSSPISAQTQAEAPSSAPQPSPSITELRQKYDAAQKKLADAQKQLEVDQQTLAAVGASTKKKAGAETASQGVPIKVSTTVKDNVLIQAVLLPRKPASRVFGKEIADNYAVVQVIIANHSKTSQLVLDSVFLDYSKWALSGVFPPESQGSCKDFAKSLPNAQQSDCPGQVASVESRVIRDELQDASTWTKRNGWVRGFVLAGQIASGFSFLGSANVASGIAGYTGNIIPGIQAFWPDQTIPQINHVSDLGFKTGKLIPKESADIVFAFFPINVFLTNGFGDIFLKDPALFFAPGQLFADSQITSSTGTGGRAYCAGTDKKSCIDPEVVNNLKKKIRTLAGDPNDTDEQFLRKATSSCTQPSPNQKEDESVADFVKRFDPECQAFESESYADTPEGKLERLRAAVATVSGPKKVLASLSLNSVEVVVSGSMTVDVDAVPATLSRVTFDNSDAAVFSKSCTTQAGTIEGQYLTGGKPSISKVDLPSDLKKDSPFYGKVATDFVDSLAVDSDKSNDLGIAFSLELKNPIPPGSTVHFLVTKPDPGDTSKTKTLKSAELLYPGDAKTLEYSPAPTLKVLSTKSCSDTSKAETKMEIKTVEASDGTETDVLTKPGNGLKGTVTGTGLKGASLTLGKVMDAGKDTSSSITEVKADPGQEDDTKLTFTFNLVNKIPAGSTVSFTASTTGADKQQATGELTVKSATAKPEAQGDAAGKKPAGKKQPVKQPAPAGRKKSPAAPTGTK